MVSSDVEHFLHVGYASQRLDDVIHLVSVCHAYLYRSVKNTILARNGDLTHVDTHLFGDDIGDILQHADAVYALDAYRGIEQSALAQLPLGVENAVAVGGL